MKCCYDGGNPQKSMRLQAVVIAAMVSVASHTAADVTASGPWHAEVAPPRAGLPAVSVDAGYPGPYVPPLSAPISLHATASSVPFDGYIGFHFAVRSSRTPDTPVVARAKLRRDSAWSFSTFATMRRSAVVTSNLPREIQVEWRDRFMRVIASQSAGTPPWASWNDLLPLGVVTATEKTPASVFGRAACLQSAAALPDRAQWYAGFSAIVLPLATWLDLTESVRKAIFASGIRVVFFGFPRPDQKIDGIGGVLLPVVFRPGPASYAAPWPYGGTTKAAPLSWSAKTDAGKVGPAQNPYIAATMAAAWGADDAAVMRPLPALVRPMGTTVVSQDALATFETEGKSIGDIPLRAYPRVFAGASATVVALCLSVGAWLRLRRRPRFVIAVAAVMAAGILLAARGRIRPPQSVREVDLRVLVADGIVDHLHVWRAYGPAPVMAGPDTAAARSGLTGDYGMFEGAEVRTTAQAPSTGIFVTRGDWDALARWLYRRELDAAPAPAAAVAPARQRFTMAREMSDFHSPTFRFADRGADATWVTGELTPGGGGALSCAFVLPSDSAWKGSAILEVPGSANGQQVEITWATGSARLTLARTGLKSGPSCEVARAIAADIASHGGVAVATITPPGAAFPFTRRIKVQIRGQKP